MKDQSKICCTNCAHIVNTEETPTRSKGYGCNLHKLYNGEVSMPEWQSCESFFSNLAKLRNDKIDTLLK